MWIEKVTKKTIKKEERIMRKTLDPGELTTLLPVWRRINPFDSPV
jgi:hypothetical protein